IAAKSELIGAPIQVELLNQSGALAYSDTPVADDSVRIADFVPGESGLYFVRITGGDDSLSYNLVINEGLTLEERTTGLIAQDISISRGVIGRLSNDEIRVAILGGAGASNLMAQLNDDTFA